MTTSGREGGFVVLLLIAALLGVPRSTAAQERGAADSVGPPPTTGLLDDAFLDPTARRLYESALAEWRRIDDTVVRYTAKVRQRLGVQLRTPLKDRTIYRAESAHRVFWDRDGESLVQVLALREQTPAGLEDEGDPDENIDWFDGAFDPTGDRLLFGMDGGRDEDDWENASDSTLATVRTEDEWGEPDGSDFYVEHPFGPAATAGYHFQSGDTLTLSFPDGRVLRAVELQVIPRYIDVHKITGSLWIEPESGALVRAVYRLSDTFDVLRDIPDLEEEAEDGLKYVPGFFKPFTFELGMIAIEYALWDFEIWLPRSLRMEGVAAAGVIKAPAAIEVAYQIESAITEADLAEEAEGDLPLGIMEEVHFETRAEAMAYMAELASREGVLFDVQAGSDFGAGSSERFLVPDDRLALLESPDLPPPIWEDAPGFVSASEVESLVDRLDDLPLPAVEGTQWAANWGLERPDLLRYNRVEGPSVGARLQLRVGSLLGPLSLSAEPFFGIADLEPKATLGITRESIQRKWEMAVYREVQTVGRREGHLGIGNSATALLWGRDDGEYYMGTGASLTLTPPTSERESFMIRAYVERHEDLDNETDFALTHAFEDGWAFRPNINAMQQDEAGVEIVIRPQWGSDPLALQTGLELYGHAATGEDTGIFTRASLMAWGAVPFSIFGWDLSARLETEGGRGWGEVPVQRWWYLGSVGTLRGYEASILRGRSFGRARVEMARVFPAMTVGLFGDAGWTGMSPSEFHFDDALASAGIGMSVLDGLLRFDLSRGLIAPRDTRFDFYLDARF